MMRFDQKRKLRPRCIGIYLVIETIGPVAYLVQMAETTAVVDDVGSHNGFVGCCGPTRVAYY